MDTTDDSTPYGRLYSEDEYITILASLPENASDEDFEKLLTYCNIAKIASARVEILLEGTHEIIGFNDDGSPRLKERA